MHEPPREPRWTPNDGYPPPQGPPPGPPGGWPTQPPGGYRYQPPQGPPRKRHVLRTVLLSIGAFILFLVVVSVALNGGHSGTPTASSSAASSAPSAPQATQAAAPKSSPTHAAAFQPETLLSQSGSGTNTTARFTVGGSGNWDIEWSYNEGGFGQAVNFAVDADNGSDFNFTGPNQMGTEGSGITHVYNDAGTHYLSVTSEGDWVIKVVTAP